MDLNLVRAETFAFENAHVPSQSDSDEILIREFRADGDDEQQMRELVFNNAFLGQPFDTICPCKQWFGDIVLGPYIEYEPENIYVAVDKSSGRLIGYLTGSMGGQQFEKRQYEMVRKKVMSLAVSVGMPWNFFDQATRQFAAHIIFKGEGERPSHPNSGVHWHFQVDRDFRGEGVGTRLLQRFIDEAVAADFDLIWAEVMVYPEKPREYFEDQGWSIYDAKPTEIFGDQVDFPVEVMCITKPLAALNS